MCIRNARVFVVVAMVVLVLPGMMLGAGPCKKRQPKTESGARQFEALWLKALQDKDTTELNCLLDDGFADTTWRGQVQDRAKALDAAKTRSDFKQQVEIRRVRLIGNTAIVWGTDIIRDKAGTIVTKIAFTDVLRYADGRWRAVSAQETEER